MIVEDLVLYVGKILHDHGESKPGYGQALLAVIGTK
jgi:hypothetical protein